MSSEISKFTKNIRKLFFFFNLKHSYNSIYLSFLINIINHAFLHHKSYFFINIQILSKTIFDKQFLLPTRAFWYKIPVSNKNFRGAFPGIADGMLESFNRATVCQFVFPCYKLTSFRKFLSFLLSNEEFPAPQEVVPSNRCSRPALESESGKICRVLAGSDWERKSRSASRQAGRAQ